MMTSQNDPTESSLPPLGALVDVTIRAQITHIAQREWWGPEVEMTSKITAHRLFPCARAFLRRIGRAIIFWRDYKDQCVFYVPIPQPLIEPVPMPIHQSLNDIQPWAIELLPTQWPEWPNMRIRLCHSALLVRKLKPLLDLPGKVNTYTLRLCGWWFLPACLLVTRIDLRRRWWSRTRYRLTLEGIHKAQGWPHCDSADILAALEAASTPEAA